MNPRQLSHRWLPRLVAGLDRFNARHPWSHNDHFHPWIVRHLPTRPSRALDVGCGRGELLVRLAGHVGHVHGIDRDAAMREAASRRVAHLPNVSVDGRELSELGGGYDVITMVAVLHHLDATSALTEVDRLLAPGGRLLVVGLSRPDSAVDWAWDTLSLLTNPAIGFVKHPRTAQHDQEPAPFPVMEPKQTLTELREAFGQRLPGTELRRHLAFRYTAAWTKPA